MYQTFIYSYGSGQQETPVLKNLNLSIAQGGIHCHLGAIRLWKIHLTQYTRSAWINLTVAQY